MNSSIQPAEVKSGMICKYKTFADLFAGGGGFSLGAVAAGLEPVFAIEHDPEIAEVHRANLGNHVIVKAVQDVNIRRLERPDVLLASPPCQSHSNARSKKLPKRDDAEIGLKILDYVRYLKPRLLIIENVEGWKRSHAFGAIFHGLHELGYWVDVQVLNAADFSVPQTRKRLFLRASLDGFRPPLPAPVRWVGWYSAIEDLLDTLPESRFADWQLRRIEEPLRSMLISNSALGQNVDNGPVCRDESEPAVTVTGGQAGRMHAFIVRPTDQLESVNVARDGDSPIWTLTNGNLGHGKVKTFIVDQTTGEDRNSERRLNIRDSGDPLFTLTANPNRTNIRAWLSQGRVVSMTPRALARFMSIPDSYELPDKNSLACRIIGNAVCPLLAKQLLA